MAQETLTFDRSTIDLRQYLQILKRRRWIIFGTIVTTVAAALLISWRMTPFYQAITRVEVQPVSSTSSEASQVLESLVDPARRLQTQAELIKSEAVLSKAADDLGLPTTKELSKALEVELVRDTQIVEIRVEHETPTEARAWADAVAKAYIAYRQERAIDQIVAASEDISRRVEGLKAKIAAFDAKTAPTSGDKAERDTLIAQRGALDVQLQSLPDTGALRRGGGAIVTPAETPEDPVRPKIILNGILALILGTMLATGLAFLAENLDDRVRTPEEVEEKTRAPVLGYVPYMEAWAGRARPVLATLDEPGSGVAEAFRTLRTNLRFLGLERPLRTMLVTSSVAEEGKSTIAANTAVAFAQGGVRTILIAADLRRPTLHKLFGIQDSTGIVDVLDPNFPVEKALLALGVEHLRLLSAGGVPPNPTEILASARFSDLLENLCQISDLVILDSPPVLGLADASALASRVDGVLMVVDAHRVSRRALGHATDQLRKAGGRILGTVLNSVEPGEGYGYYYQDYYTQYAGDGSKIMTKEQGAAATIKGTT